MSNIDRYRKQLKQFEAKRSNFFKLETGVTNKIWILEPRSPEEDFYAENKVHFLNGAGDNGTTLGIGCIGEGCRVCKVLSKMETSNDSECNTYAEKSKATSSYLMNVVDMKNIETGVQIFRTTSDRVISDLVGFICDPEWGEFFNSKKGRVVNIKSEKQGGAWRYTTTLAPKTSAIDPELLKQRKNLAKFIQAPDKEQINKAVSFLKEILGDEETEDLSSAKSRLKKKSKFRSLRRE